MSWWGSLDDQKKAAAALLAVGAGGVALGATLSSFAAGLWNAPTKIAVLEAKISELNTRLASLEEMDFVVKGEPVSIEHGADRAYFLHANAQPSNYVKWEVVKQDSSINDLTHKTFIFRPPLNEKDQSR